MNIWKYKAVSGDRAAPVGSITTVQARHSGADPIQTDSGWRAPAFTKMRLQPRRLNRLPRYSFKLVTQLYIHLPFSSCNRYLTLLWQATPSFEGLALGLASETCYMCGYRKTWLYSLDGSSDPSPFEND